MGNIKQIAIRSEERYVVKKFTESEMQEKKDSFINNSLKLTALKSELENIKLEYKTRMEPVKKSIEQVFKDLKTGSYETLTVVYLVDNQEEGKMEYYTEDGEMIYSRPLLPNEKQLHLIKGVM